MIMTGKGTTFTVGHTQYQGSCDCLCGLYSVVNGVSVALESARHPHAKSLCQSLFSLGITELERQGRLHRALTWGMSHRQMKSILKATDVWLQKTTGMCLSWRKPYYNKLDVPFIELQGLLEEHLDQEGSSAILCLWGALDHWTAAYRLTPRRILLRDSDGTSSLRLSCCDTVDPKISGKRHQVIPTGLYLLKVSPREMIKY
ncbi:MAG: hypothetical protein COB46_03550 [Rhodospirillaceae bacterium]|nr:MAG: hypothetical protein COB46_03550 [Rhodospirillaceae bacterium]